MKVQIDRTEIGTTVKAKDTRRHARILGVITRCQPDGFSLTLYEAVTGGNDIPHGYCHIPAFRVQEQTVRQLEAAAARWVADGVTAPACQQQPLE